MTPPSPQPHALFPIIFASLLGWGSVNAILHILQNAPAWITIPLHTFLTLLIFGVVFSLYYHWYKNAHPFTTTAVAVLAYITAEMVFWTFAFPHEQPYQYCFVDWIMPLFAATSVMYFLGLLFQRPPVTE
jgi:hypothetical protein